MDALRITLHALGETPTRAADSSRLTAHGEKTASSIKPKDAESLRLQKRCRTARLAESLRLQKRCRTAGLAKKTQNALGETPARAADRSRLTAHGEKTASSIKP